MAITVETFIQTLACFCEKSSSHQKYFGRKVDCILTLSIFTLCNEGSYQSNRAYASLWTCNQLAKEGWKAYRWRCKQCHRAVLFRNASRFLVKLSVRSREKLGQENCFIVTHFPISLLMSVHMFNVWLCWIWSLSWKSSSNLKHLLCEFLFPWSHIIVHCLLTTFKLKPGRHVCEEIYEIWEMITHNGEIAKKMLCLDNCELKCENFFRC